MTRRASPGSAPSVFIADGQRLFADALARGIKRRSGFRVIDQHALSGIDVLHAVQVLKPDVVLLDYWVKDLQGPGVIRALSSLAPACRVVLLAWHQTAIEVQNGLLAGALAFLPKSVTLRQTIDTIADAIKANPQERRSEIESVLVDLEQADPKLAGVWRRMEDLTPRELEVIALLAAGRPTRHIAMQLLIEEKTVSNYIKRALMKTGAHSQLEMSALARHVGFVA